MVERLMVWMREFRARRTLAGRRRGGRGWLGVVLAWSLWVGLELWGAPQGAAGSEVVATASGSPSGAGGAGGAAGGVGGVGQGGGVSLWDGSISLRTWAGYRDNPQLSSVNRVGSAFLAGGGEAMLFRLPLDGWEATFYGLLEHLGYFESELAPETIGVVDARGKRTWGDGWWVGAALEYFYLKQVFDASEIVGFRVVIPAEGHTLGFRPTFGKTMGTSWRWEVEPELARQWLAEPLDSFLDTGARVQWVRLLGRGSEVGIAYRYRNRAFDERPPRDGLGGVEPGTLAYDQHEWEPLWKGVWGEKRRWRTTVRGGYLWSVDNGGGFFDYHRFQLGGLIRYSDDTWELRAEARARWYMYPVQRASLTDGPRRRRTDWTFVLRGDWKVRRGWRLFAELDYDLSDENMAAADYRAMSISGGVEWEL